MLQNVNLEEVKRYNASLKQYKDRAATLNAEIEYTNKELDSLCTELSAELGITVNRENIEQVYKEHVDKINYTLQSGNAVLAKIASEEQSIANGQSAVQQPQQMVGQQQVVGQTPVMNQSQVVTPQAPVQAVGQTPVNPQATFNTQPVQGSVFNGQTANAGVNGANQTLPPLFSI